MAATSSSENGSGVDSNMAVVEELRQEVVCLKAELKEKEEQMMKELEEERKARTAAVQNRVDAKLKQNQSKTAVENSERQRQLVKLTKVNTDLKKEIEVLTAKNNELQQQLTGETRNVERVRDESATKDSATAELSQQHSLEIRKRETTIFELQERLKVVEGSERSAKVEIAGLQNSLGSLEAQAHSLKEENERLQRNRRESHSDPTPVQTPRGGVSSSSSANPPPTTSTTAGGGSSPELGSPIAPQDVFAMSANNRGSGGPVGGPNKARYEGMIQEKEKRIVVLSNENRKYKQNNQGLEQDKKTLEQQVAVLEASKSKIQEELEESLALAKARFEDLTELRGNFNKTSHIQQELEEQVKTDKALITILEEKDKDAQAFRAAHVHCSTTLTERDRTIKSLENKNEIVQDQLEHAQRKLVQKQERIDALDREKKATEDKRDVDAGQHGAQTRSLNNELDTARKSIAELRSATSEKNDELSRLRKSQSEEQGKWDSERSSLNHKITSLEGLVQQMEAQIVEGQQGGGRSTQLSEEQIQQLRNQIETLTGTINSLETDKVRLAEEVAALQGDVANKKSTIQRISLEKMEKEQQFNRLEKNYNERCEEVDTLIDQIRQLEGNDEVKTSMTKMVVGQLEAFTPELLQEVAEGLNVDHMRGAPRMAMMFSRRFRLDEEVTAETMLLLCRIFFFQKYSKLKLKDIADSVRVAESLLRRVSSAFSEVIHKFQPTDRRIALLNNTPPEARHLYVGHERMALLCCAKAPKLRGTLIKSSSSSAKKGEEGTAFAQVLGKGDSSGDFCLSLILSYLPIVLKGATAFVSHTIHHDPRAGPEGTTRLIVLNPLKPKKNSSSADLTSSSSGTTNDNYNQTDTTTPVINTTPKAPVEQGHFTLMECQVARQRCVSVIISGTYRRSMSYQSNTNIRLTMQCTTKKDGACFAAEGGSSSAEGGEKWEWGKEEVFPMEEAPLLQYILERESNADGLVLSEFQSNRSSSGGGGVTYGLREISVEEVAMLQNLYGGTLSLDAMCQHRSWAEIPGPIQLRRR